MSLNALPTDNLYKFIALSGLVTFLSSAYFGGKVYLDDRDKWWGHFVRYELQKVEMSYLEEEIADIKERISPSKETLADQMESSPLTVEEFQQLRHRAKAMRQDVLREDLDHKRLKIVDLRIAILMWGSLSIAGAGLAVSIFGFRLWYLRLQRYQDAALKQKVQNGNAT